MHLCYVDDSGRDGIVTFTGLLVPAAGWNCLLSCWLDGRQQLSREPTWRVDKHAELHANVLLKRGSGRFCEPGCAQPGCADAGRCGESGSDCCAAECCVDRCCGQRWFEGRFSGQGARDSAYRIMMEKLSRCPALTVTTVACHTRNSPKAYQGFVNRLDRWAADNDTSVVIFLDGPQGPIDSTGMTVEQIKAEQDRSTRNAAPYRRTHRELDLGPRRVIEDPLVTDSRYSQLIQAADLVAYGAYQHLWSAGGWPSGGRYGGPNANVVKAYRKLAPRWLPGSDSGIDWA